MVKNQRWATAGQYQGLIASVYVRRVGALLELTAQEELHKKAKVE